MKRTTRLILYLFITISYTHSLAGDDVDPIKSALDLTHAKQYQKAYEILLPLAEQGNTRAQDRLGYLMLRGDSDSNKYYDVKMGLTWVKKAAEAGDAAAQWGLTKELTYDPYFRENTKARFKESYKWLDKAAEQGYAMAQLDIAEYFRNGRGGVEQDHVKAYMWYTLAHRRFTNTDDKNSGLTPDLISFASDFRDELVKKGYVNEAQVKQALKMADDWEKSHPKAYKRWPIPELTY